MASAAQIAQSRKAAQSRVGKSTRKAPTYTGLVNYKVRRHNENKPLALEFIEGQWWISGSAGPIPASPWEIELWVELVEARERIKELEGKA